MRKTRGSRLLPVVRLVVAALLVASGIVAGVAGQTKPLRRGTQKATKSAKPAAAAINFEQVKGQADQAREAGRIEEAIGLYQKAVMAQPTWIDGWWYLGTLHYDRDEYKQAAGAFQRVSVLQPGLGAPLAMLGLCEFRLGEYDSSLTHLRQGRRAGVGDNQSTGEMGRVMRYHEGQLLLLKGDFETAQNIFGVLSYDNVTTEDLFIGHGLASLRLAMLPSQVKADYRDRNLIRRAGFAEHLYAQKNFGDAQREYEQLVADYPRSPGVQYAYGKFMINQRNDEAAVDAFVREIEVSPSHALARLQIAYIKLRNREAAAGLRYAREAVNLNPRLSLGHYVLGRSLLETGETAESIAELEVARKLSPNEPRIHFVLSRAYAKAGRKAEADQARETFVRLNKLVEESVAQGNLRGEVISEGPERP